MPEDDRTNWLSALNPAKHTAAHTHPADAGPLDRVEAITGEALSFLAALPGPFKFALPDADKQTCFPCFEPLRGRLTPGALIAADNMIFPESEHAGAYQE